MIELKPGDVGELDSETGARLLYAAGTPEAEAWIAENSQPHDLDDPTPLPLDAETAPDVRNDPVPEAPEPGEDDTATAPEAPTEENKP